MAIEHIVRDTIDQGAAIRLVIEVDVAGYREIPNPDDPSTPYLEPYGSYTAARVECDPGAIGYVAAWIADVDSGLRLWDVLGEVTAVDGRSGELGRVAFDPPLLDDQTHDPRIETNLVWFSEVRHTELQQGRVQLNLPKVANPAQRRNWEQRETRTRSLAEQRAHRGRPRRDP